MTSKGLTPVIATVLLITISVAATASAYSFINTVQQDTQSHMEEELAQEERETKTSINMDYVYNSSGYLTLNVRNTGTLSLNFRDDGENAFDLYIDGSPVEEEWRFEGGYEGDDDVIVSQQETVAINTTESYPSEDEDAWIEFMGPYSTYDSYVCYNSGGSSC